jgi:dihydroorotate dehydrogenase (NAD+) catalytic subunit
MARLNVKIGTIAMKNPVMLASGTYEYNDTTRHLMKINRLGAIVAKTITLKPTEGNPPPRTCEASAGMLNAIGLQNRGVDIFLQETLPHMKTLKTPVIASIAGGSIQEFRELAKRLDAVRAVAGIELNLSCPNVRRKKLFSHDARLTARTVAAVKGVTRKPVIAKLSPNVTDIATVAASAEAAGADAIAAVNTLIAMAIDAETRTPKLGNITGGLSGPAMKPVALQAVWKIARAVRIPVIGMGGIVSGEDALEFIIAGATAVALGTGCFVRPDLGIEVLEGMKLYLKKHGIAGIKSLKGSLRI